MGDKAVNFLCIRAAALSRLIPRIRLWDSPVSLKLLLKQV